MSPGLTQFPLSPAVMDPSVRWAHQWDHQNATLILKNPGISRILLVANHREHREIWECARAPETVDFRPSSGGKKANEKNPVWLENALRHLDTEWLQPSGSDDTGETTWRRNRKMLPGLDGRRKIVNFMNSLNCCRCPPPSPPSWIKRPSSGWRLATWKWESSFLTVRKRSNQTVAD